MAPRRRNINDIQTPLPTTQTELDALLNQRVADALAQHEANRARTDTEARTRTPPTTQNPTSGWLFITLPINSH